MESLHDWLLDSIQLDWGAAIVKLHLQWQGAHVLTAEGVTDLQVPHAYPWGPSQSVLEHDGPIDVGNGVQSLKVQMQSGDLITISGRSFILT
jgi:hypothetical protein